MQVASFAGSGLSMDLTGKTLSDHALSFAAQQDCAFMRLLDDKPLCREPVTVEVRLPEPVPAGRRSDAAARALAEPGLAASVTTPLPAPHGSAEAAAQGPPSSAPYPYPAQRVAVLEQSPTAASGSGLLALGVFRSQRNAEAIAARARARCPAVSVNAPEPGRWVVRCGPVPRTELAALAQRLREAGITIANPEAQGMPRGGPYAALNTDARDGDGGT